VTVADRLIGPIEQELARFALGHAESQPEDWDSFAQTCDPTGLWHPTGWVPVPECDAVIIEPTIFCRATAVLGATETRQYRLAGSLVCAAAIRPFPGESAADPGFGSRRRGIRGADLRHGAGLLVSDVRNWMSLSYRRLPWHERRFQYQSIISPVIAKL
jgi:hypothetical protein